VDEKQTGKAQTCRMEQMLKKDANVPEEQRE
jgi:hypothetical protein